MSVGRNDVTDVVGNDKRRTIGDGDFFVDHLAPRCAAAGQAYEGLAA